MKAIQRIALVTICTLTWFVALTAQAEAQRIRDLARVAGERHRQLQGIGLVVGLTGTGDGQQNESTKKFLLKMIQNSGNFPEVSLDDLKSRNVALVEVTASVPTSLRVGSEFEVAVSSIGDAESLRGGSLIGVPLRGPGVVKGDNGLSQFDNYGLAHGSIFSEHEAKGKLTVGKARAILEKRMYEGDLFSNLDEMTLILLSLDFGTAYRVERKINQHDLFRDPTAPVNAPSLAKALDSSSVAVRIPTSYLSRNRVIDFISQVMEIEVPEIDREALVAINRQTGSVVINGAVRVASSATTSFNNVLIRVPAQEAAADPNDPAVNPFDRNPLLIDVIKVLKLEDFTGTEIAHILRQLQRVGAIIGKFVEDHMDANSGLQISGTSFQPLVDMAKFDSTESALHKSTEDFEAIFVRLVLSEMMPKDNAFFGKGAGANTYQSMFVSAIADELGSRGALGIGQSLRSEISQRGLNVDPEAPSKETKAPVVGAVLDLAG